MNNTLTTKEFHDLIARKICVTNKLQKGSEELIASVSVNVRLDSNDLVTFSNAKAFKAEENLEIAHEQIKDLKRELDNIK